MPRPISTSGSDWRRPAQPTPAIISYEAALAIDPAEPFASYNLGKLLHARGVPVAAERLLRQALQSRPEFPEAQVVLAGVLGSQGNIDASGGGPGGRDAAAAG